MNFDWDPDKNIEIQKKHGISFEDVVDLVSRRHLIKSISNPNPKHKDQKIMLIRRGDAVYLVPYEIRNGKRWLITAFYSEFFTRKHSR